MTTRIVFLNVLVVATCGLIYELLAAAVASYTLGDSVTQFSLVIGLYLSALGLGAWLSRFIEAGIARRFIEVELAVALIGGFSAPLLFLSFAKVQVFRAVLYGTVGAVGTLVGLELPLLMRIMKDRLEFKDLVSRVLAFDYVGSLAASVLFPLLLVPELGLVRTSLLFGMLNAGVGLWGTWLLEAQLEGRTAGLRVRAAAVLVALACGLGLADRVTSLTEELIHPDEIVLSETSRYQRIVVTRSKAGFNLYLNGHLQFSSVDEYRYHESLVHPAIAAVGSARRVLVLGGGDGLAVREVLRHPVEEVVLVDLDPAMTTLHERFPPLAELSRGALADPRVRVVNQDALIWLEKREAPFDLAIVDFPDPNTFSLGKLYTTRFYRLLREHLAPDAAVAVQCTSPLLARRSYWCIVRTLEAAGFSVKPYAVAVPSFGVWGFALARQRPFEVPDRAPLAGLRFLDDAALRSIFLLPADLGPLPAEVNRLDNQVLVRYYEAEWGQWN